MSILTTFTTGNENLEGASASVYAFVCHNGGEHHINKAAQLVPYLVSRNGQMHVTDARPGGDHVKFGSWKTCNYALEEGTVVKVVARRKSRWDDVGSCGATYLRARADGPLLLITIELSGNGDAARERVEIRGRFDILSFEEATALPGVFRQDATRSMHNRAGREAMFAVRQLEAALSRSRAVVPVRQQRAAAAQPAQTRRTRTSRAAERSHAVSSNEVRDAAEAPQPQPEAQPAPMLVKRRRMLNI